MNISAGLVGLPNVGKSTLFNALTRSSVPAENYPFCTIEPHLAITAVPDARIPLLQKIYGSHKTIPSTVQFVDIAGLVKGAASGQGLGNQFLNHIREVDLILHVIRCFDDASITSDHDNVDPIRDFEIIVTELMLKDAESLEKRIAKVQHSLKGAQQKPAEKKELEAELELIAQLQAALNNGDLDRVQELCKSPYARNSFLLSGKPFLIIANFAEDKLGGNAYQNEASYRKLVERFGAERIVATSARIAYELSALPAQEQQEMASFLGIDHNGLDEIIQSAYTYLGLITFFTCGPQEIHAWPLQKGTLVRPAAGEIHSDLQRGFICAEVFNAHDLLQTGSVQKLKDTGKVRTEGQDYMVKDGDIILVKFNV